MNHYQTLSLDNDNDDDNNDNDIVDNEDSIVDKIAVLLGKQTASSIPWQLMIGSYERNEKTYDNVNDYTNNLIWIGSGYLSSIHVNNFIAFNCYIDWINRIHNNTIRNLKDTSCLSSGTKFNVYNDTSSSSFKKKIFRHMLFSSEDQILIGYPEVGVTVTVEQLLSAALHSKLLNIIGDDNDNNDNNIAKIDIILPTPISIKSRNLIADSFDIARRLLPTMIASKAILNSVRSTAAALALSFIQTIKARRLLQARNGKIRICIVEIGEEYICTSFVSLESISSIVINEDNSKSITTPDNSYNNSNNSVSTPVSTSKKKKKKKSNGISPIKEAIPETPLPLSEIGNSSSNENNKDSTIIPAVVRIESSSGTCLFGLKDADMQLIQLWFLEIFKLIDHHDDVNSSALNLWNKLGSKTQDICLNAVFEFRIMKVENIMITIPVKSSKSASSSSSHVKYHPSFIKLCDKLLHAVFYSSCKSLSNSKLPYPMIITEDDARKALEKAFLYYGNRVEINDKSINKGSRFEANGIKFEIGSLNSYLRNSIKDAITGQQSNEPAEFTQRGELIEVAPEIDTLISWQEGHASAYNVVSDHYNVSNGCIIDNVIRNILSEELSKLMRKDSSTINAKPNKNNGNWKVGNIVVDAFATGLQIATNVGGLVPTTSKKTNNKEIAEKLIQSMTCRDVADLPLSLQTQWFELSASLVWEGLARLQIMDSVYLTQNPCIRVYESLPFPLGLRLKDGNNQSKTIWLLDSNTMKRRNDKSFKSLDSIREDTEFFIQSNSKDIGIYEMKRSVNRSESQVQADELFFIDNFVMPSKSLTQDLQLSIVQLAETDVGNEKDKVSMLSMICAFDIDIGNPYYLSIQRYGGLHSFSLQTAVDKSSSSKNTYTNLSPNLVDRTERKFSKNHTSTNFFAANRSLMTKVSLTIIIVAVILHTVATYIAITSNNFRITS